MPRLRLKIYGHVQGVFYRENAKELAGSLGLAGWVKNCPDGTVEILAEGEKPALDKLLQWCQTGSAHARVEKVEETWEEVNKKGFSEFRVEY